MDDEPKHQKKKVCRFFTSKGKCYINNLSTCDLMTYLLLLAIYCASRDIQHATTADCLLQAAVRAMTVRTPILLGKKDRLPRQNRTARAAMQHYPAASRGDISHRL